MLCCAKACVSLTPYVASCCHFEFGHVLLPSSRTLTQAYAGQSITPSHFRHMLGNSITTSYSRHMLLPSLRKRKCRR